MNIVDRDRRFREAEGALLHAVRVASERGEVDPVSLVFALVHRTSSATFAAAMQNGATDCGDGFAMLVSERRFSPDDPMARIPRDHVACMISIGEHHKALGIPIENVKPKPDPKRPSATPLDNGDNGLNVAAVIRFLWEMDLEDSTNAELVARVRAWRQRVEVVRHACAVLAVPPSLDDLLWEHGNGAEVERRLKAIPCAPGQNMIRTDFDLFDVILDEPSEARS